MAEEQQNEEDVGQEEQNQRQEDENIVFVNTHEKIDNGLCGDVEELKRGFARVSLQTTEVMRADRHGLVHGGFVFSAADYAAMLAVNEKNVVLAAANAQFLAPSRVGDIITFEAVERQRNGRKRSVFVTGHAYDIKVFEGEFNAVVTDNHVLNLTLLQNAEEAIEEGTD